MNSDSKFIVMNREKNPFLSANFLSKWSFWWTLKLFRKGSKTTLKEEDIYEHKPSFDTTTLTEKFTKLWNDELKRKQPSIVHLIIRAYGLYFLPLCIGFAILETVAKIAQPYCLGNLLAYFSQNENEIITKTEAYLYATGIVISLLSSVSVLHPLLFYVLEIGLRVRLGLSGLVYDKILKLSKCGLSDGLSAKAINVLSNDVGKFDSVFSFVHDTLVGPMQVIALGYLAYTEMGYSSFVGIGFLLSFIPVEVWGAKKAAQFHQRTAKRTDYRVKLMNEIIQGIQVIKMYAWEKCFEKILGESRKDEIKQIRGTSSIYAFLETTSIIPKFAVFFTIITYIYTDDAITARKVFTVSNIYDVLNRSLIYYWPTAINYMAQANISAKRILEVLLENENNSLEQFSNGDGEEKFNNNDKIKIKILNLSEEQNPKTISLQLKNVSASWSFNSNNTIIANASNALIDFNVNIKDKQFFGVIGAVGSGKSSFLNAILGELQITNGYVFGSGKLSYASQEAWVFESTIRNNIIFTEQFDIDRYNKVIQVCALEEDLLEMRLGDLTMVGERGISLSGGQKARINLARAVYRKADIYLLDDPLSAVDAHVAKHIFEKCLKEFLNNKIRILVTHQVQYLETVDNIIFINNGNLEFQGTYKDLKKFDKFKYLSEYRHEDEDKLKNKKENLKKSKTSLVKEILKKEGGSVNETIEDHNENRKEKLEEGSVKFKVFYAYFKALENWMWFILVVLLFIATRAIVSGVDYFISRWVIWEEDKTKFFLNLMKSFGNILTHSNTDDIDSSRTDMIIIYSSLLGTALILYILRSFGFFLMCLRISLKLHDKMFTGIIRATMYFFNLNPSGRILNRFSKDINIVDTLLPMTLIDCVFFITDITAIVVMVSLANYWLLIPAFIMALVLYFIRDFYINTSRSVKRIESTTRSPIYSHINQTFQGLTTIRAAQAQSSMEKEFHKFQNRNASSWYLLLATTRAFALWLDILCVFYIALVTYSFLLLEAKFYSGDVGLAISQSIALITMCQWGIRQTAELEIYMINVERILEYTYLKSEPSYDKDTPNCCSKNDWPSEGKITFSNFNFKYSDNGEYILKNLNFEIKQQEKIGIVGRTGAGKSSLIQSIFRLACNEGKIQIDDVDINQLGLHDLRSKISIIPQDPVLFSGTLRYNLDPFEKSNDTELWNALAKVELKEYVSSMREGLNCKISDGGSNFSMGQRQLVCLARAILRHNKILILDEATSNVDPEADKLIQKTIHTKFEYCTVLTIAHRLHTVMDSDKVLVMDAGQIVEFDTPFELLQKSNGFLKSLVDQTGTETANILLQIADNNQNQNCSFCVFLSEELKLCSHHDLLATKTISDITELLKNKTSIKFDE